MTDKKRNTFIKVLTTVTFLVMITVNALANIIPINGVNTGQVSDFYKNLFAPAGITFIIWGIIYLLLAGYTIYQLGIFQIKKSISKSELFNKVGFYFSVSSITNAVWIFSWHYKIIALSMLLMIIILTCLILIIQEINKQELSLRENLFIRIPFSVYFGWITVATIANATTLLVSLGWKGFGISEPVWTAIIIVIGLVIGVATMLKNKDIAYGIVLIWAYAGILIKHTSATGFAGKYPTIITTLISCIALLLAVEAYILTRRKLNIVK